MCMTWYFPSLYFVLNSQPFVTIPTSGATKSTLTFQEERLGLTHKRPSHRPTGKHLSPRSVLVWRLGNRSSSSSSTSRPTLCTHWSLMGNTAPLHWAVTSGRRWLVHRPLCSTTVTRKASMSWVRLLIPILKWESELLLTMKMTAPLPTPESGLVQQGLPITPTRVEMWPSTQLIMERNSSKPWVTSWCSDKESDITLETSRRCAVRKTEKWNQDRTKIIFDSFFCRSCQLFFFFFIRNSCQVYNKELTCSTGIWVFFTHALHIDELNPLAPATDVSPSNWCSSQIRET